MTTRSGDLFRGDMDFGAHPPTQTLQRLRHHQIRQVGKMQSACWRPCHALVKRDALLHVSLWAMTML
jgi:hypothetical protein